MKKYIIFNALLLIFGVFTQSCLTSSQGMVTKEESIPVDWGENSAERIYSQVISIMNQNIRRFDYYLYTHSIIQNSKEDSWHNEIRITSYSNGERISLIFNYFAIDLDYTNNRDFKVSGIPAQIATMRGSANDFNSTVDRIKLLIDRIEYSDNILYLIDLIWLDKLKLQTVSTNN